MISWPIVLAPLIAAATLQPPAPEPAAELPPPVDHSIALVQLVESFQPPDPHLPNRWSQAMRAAFLYGGALRTFTAQSPVITRYLAWESPSRESRAPSDLMLALIGELPTDLPPDLAADMSAEARRLLAILQQEDILFHLDQLAEPCRLVAPPPYRDDNSPLLSQETFELGAFKNLAIVCAARMREQAAGGDHLRAMKSLASGMRLGRAACGRPMLLSLFSGQAIQNRLMLQAMELARRAEPPLDGEMLDLIDRILERLPLPSAETFLEMERLIGHDAIDRYYRGLAIEEALAEAARQEAAAAAAAEPPGEEPPTSPTPPPETAPVQRLTIDEARTIFNRAIDRCIEYTKRRVPSVDRPAGAAADLPLGPAGDPRLIDLPPGRDDPDGLVRNLMPPVGQMVAAELEHRAVRAGLSAAVLLERHRGTHGRYPQTIAELGIDPAAPVQWPKDPCVPDRPLSYRFDASTGRYMLYSVGVDGVDNDAAPAQRTRNAFVPGPRGEGTDFIITPPR